MSRCIPHLQVTQGVCLQLGSSWEGRRILAVPGGSCCWRGSGQPPRTGTASMGPSLLATSRVFGFAAWQPAGAGRLFSKSGLGPGQVFPKINLHLAHKLFTFLGLILVILFLFSSLLM